MEPTLPPSPSPINRFARIPPAPTMANTRGSGHRRAYSETLFCLPDDLFFDSDADFNISDIEFPSLSDDNVSSGGPSNGDTAGSELNRGPGAAAAPAPAPAMPAGPHHGRSLSVDAAFFDGLGFQQGVVGGGVGGGPRHKRSGSMDGSISPLEGDSSTATSSDYAKKAMAADKLAELSLMDPKRAKRWELFSCFRIIFVSWLISWSFFLFGVRYFHWFLSVNC